jgi:putative DNA primase/helicase
MLNPGTFDADAAHTFLTTIFGGKPDEHWLLLWDLQRKHSVWLQRTDDILSMAEVGCKMQHDLYIGCGTSPQDVGTNQRCKADEIAGIGAVWADIDVKSPVHTKTNLCPDIETAIIWARALRPVPDFIINSGHGLQLWWALDEFWSFIDSNDRETAAGFVARWREWLRFAAPAWEIDATQDLSRIMRLPGTWNYKDRSDPRPVEIVDA